MSSLGKGLAGFGVVCWALAVVAGAISPARAGLEEGRQAYRNGNFDQAFQEFMPLAQAGDLAMQNQIAGMYYTGQGTPQDFEKAAEWFRKAAQSSSPEGQYCLGKLYYYGQGVPQNFEEAGKWLTEAGLSGKGGAQYLLAVLYLYGKGVSKNEVKAYFWTILAGQSEDIPADDKTAATALRAQIESLLTAKQMDSIQAMVRNWTPRRKKTAP